MNFKYIGLLIGLVMLPVINLPAQTTMFYDNCNSMANWTNVGKIYPANLPGYDWMSVAPTLPPNDNTGGGNCLYVNGNANYVTAGAGNYILYQIVSNPINLSGWNNTRLEFYMQMRSETGNWDGGFIDWSHDGVNWTQLNAELCVPYDGNMSQNQSSTPFYPFLKPAWFNYRTTWTRVLANISALDNVSQFYLRFTFHSDEEAMERGWAIDDIRIVSVAMIQLQGNNLVIPGNNTPITTNNTDFGGCAIGQFIDKEFFIHNTGESPLTLTGNPLVQVTGTGFSVLTQPAVNIIPPGQSVPFTIRFQPGALGNFNGTVSIPHSDIYSACTVVNPFVYNIKASSLNTPPLISGLQNITICPGAGPVSIPFMVSDNEQPTTSVTVSGVSSNQAMIPDGNISFTGTGDNRELIFTSLPGQTGEVIITLTANDGQAFANTSTATVTITLEDTEPPVALCQNAIVQLNPQGVGNITALEIDNGSTDNCQLGTFSLSQTQFSCADVGIQTVTLTVNDAIGNASTCEADITVLPPPVQLSLSAFQYAGGFEISCMGASDGTVTALPSGGCAPYTFEWVELPGFNGETASQLPAGSYTVILTDAAGQSVPQQITLEEPTALQNISSSLDVTCFGKADGRVNLAVQGGVPPYAFSAGPQISGLPQGNYTYSATDANGCAISMNFTIVQPQEIVLNVLPLVSVQCGEQIPLLAEAFNGTGEYTYYWNGPGIDCPNCATTYAIASQTVIYDATVTDENGCSKTGQTRAEVSCNLYIPNAFTPGNGDMLNPVFRVYSGDLERFSFAIFDRWGQRIYASSNPTEGWDGRIKNNQAPQGIYVYRLLYKFPGGKETQVMGSFALLTGD